jgi:hypothetical protein
MQPSNRVGRCRLRYPGPLAGIPTGIVDSLVLDARYGAAEWWQPNLDHIPATWTPTPAYGGWRK